MSIKFELVGNKVVIPASSLTVPELKVLWSRDKDKKKNKAFQELSYVYHMSDPKSEYSAYSQEHKEATIIKDHIKEAKWKPDKAVIEAIVKYKHLQETPALRFLNSQYSFLDKVTERINNLDIDDLEDDKTITAMLNASEKASKLITMLPKLKEAVIKEQATSDKIRGGGTVGRYEE